MTATYSTRQMDAAQKYATQRRWLYILKFLAENRPQIGSAINVQVLQATQEDYEFPASFAHRAIKVEFDSIDEDGCGMLACNTNRSDGEDCTPTTKPFPERNGDTDEIIMKCQFGCYQMHPPAPNASSEGQKPSVQSPALIYVGNKCRYQIGTDLMLQTPSVRGQEKYIVGVNDSRVGLTAVAASNGESTYVYNDPACEILGKDCVNGACVSKNNAVVEFLFGEYLLRIVREGLKGDLRVPDATKMRPDPRPPAPAAPKHLTDEAEWRRHIRVGWVAPDPDMDVPGTSGLHRRTVRAVREDGKKDKETWIDIAGKMLKAILSEEGMKLLLIGHYTNELKNLIVKVLTSLSKEFLKRIATVATEEAFVNAGRHVLEAAMTTSLKAFIKVQMRMFLYKTASKLLESLASAATIIGLVIDIGGILDIVLQFWDPFKYHKQQEFTPVQVAEMMQVSRNQFKVEWAQISTEYAPHTALTLALTADEHSEMSKYTFLATLEYLVHLEVDGNGNVIDKGNLLSQADFDAAQNEAAYMAAVTRGEYITQPIQLYRYTGDLDARLDVLHTLRLSIGATLLLTMLLALSRRQASVGIAAAGVCTTALLHFMSLQVAYYTGSITQSYKEKAPPAVQLARLLHVALSGARARKRNEAYAQALRDAGTNGELRARKRRSVVL